MRTQFEHNVKLPCAEDGTINRKVLGGLVFADSEKMKKLNTIVWPEIGRLAADKAILASMNAPHQCFGSSSVYVDLDLGSA